MNNTNNSEYKKYVSANYNILFYKKNNYVKISFNKNLNRYFTFTINQFMDINFYPFKFQQNEDDEYPYYLRNNKKNSLVEFLYGFNFDDLTIEFKNNDKYDLRKNNVIFTNHKYFENIKDKFEIKKYINGYARQSGADTYIIKNPIWITNNDKYIMYCGNDKHIIMCKKTYDILKKYEKENKKRLIFTINKNNYVVSSEKIYLHQIIKEHFKSNNFGFKIYINGNRNDNTFENFFVDKLPDYCIEDYLSYLKNKKLIIKKFIDGRFSKKLGYHNNYKIIVYNLDSNEDYVLFNINKNTFTKIDYETMKDFEKDNNAWYLHSNGYVAAWIKSIKKYLYLHQYIMNCYGNGKGIATVSVDHINNDKLDNRKSNLRMADFKTQHSNAKGIKPGTKRERKQNAAPLKKYVVNMLMKIHNGKYKVVREDGTIGVQLPKYVQHYNDNKECKNDKDDDNNEFTRNFFRIEKHPNLKKIGRSLLSSTKSTKVSIKKKFLQIEEMLNKLDNEQYATLYLMPRGISRKIKHEKKVELYHNKKINGIKFDLRRIYMIKVDNYNNELLIKLKEFQEILKTKYEKVNLQYDIIENDLNPQSVRVKIIKDINELKLIYDERVDKERRNLKKSYEYSEDILLDIIKKFQGEIKKKYPTYNP